MQIVDSADPPLLGNWPRHWVYNARDCCLTAEVDDALVLDSTSQAIYDFEMSMYPMCFVIMDRGVRVDLVARAQLTSDYQGKVAKLEQWLNFMADAIWGKPLNFKSPSQLMAFFYDHMKIPVQYKRNAFTGEQVPTVDRGALEKLEKYLYARPFVSTIMRLRDYDMTLRVLKAKLHEDGRMRFSFNPAGTETQRWSSSRNPDRTGTNFQNITPDLRRMFIADPGYKLGYADLSQAESRAVAYLSRDEKYIEACESGDLHTAVAKLIWPDMAWPNDPKKDKEQAEQPYYRHFSYRDISKRGGHASNYLGKPYHLAKTLRVDEQLFIDFQANYFSVFNRIKVWHHEIEQELTSTGQLISPTGFRRQFLKRLGDESTLKEAIAFKPQNIVGHTAEEGMLQVFNELEPKGLRMLGNMHDAIVFQYPIDKPNLAEEAREIMSSVATDYPEVGKKTIPSDLKVGYNWLELKPFGKDDDQTPPNYSAGLLATVV